MELPDPIGPRLAPPRLGGAEEASTSIRDLSGIFSAHHPGADLSRIEAAFRCADEAHAGVLRRSGDPYISHPIEVAEIVADLGLDEAAVCAALLHDVVEDTDVTLDDITALFDDPRFAGDVALLVAGMTKLDGLHFDSEQGRRAEDLRRLFTAIAADPRVLVIKLSDRLHNMRTISALPAPKRERIASETLEVFGPLAHRLGMSRLRVELEDLSFKTLHPERFAAIERQVEDRRAAAAGEVTEILTELRRVLAAGDITVGEVSWRVKSTYGIWAKMQRRGRTFDEIFDVIGVRVICGTVGDCYAALGAVHATFAPLPNQIKDHIATPKFNRYQSLHTTVIGPSGKAVEVQFRTAEMHSEAEWGVASHWAYKERQGGSDVAGAELVSWMRQLLEAGDDVDEGEFLDEMRAGLAGRDMFCITPNGRVVELPAGSTPIDFAYQVHTEIGDRAIGARVNGAQVGLDHVLATGDRVEIITSNDPNRGPNRRWLTWAATPKARQRIRRWHTRRRHGEAAAAGRRKVEAAVTDRAGRLGVAFDVDTLDVEIDRVRSRWGLPDVDGVTAAVSEGTISAEAVAARILPEPARRRRSRPEFDEPRQVLVDGEPGVEVFFARCCDAQRPQELLGWITNGRGVSVHRRDCVNVADLLRRDRSRVVAVSWVGEEPAPVLTLTVESFDRHGQLADISAALSACSVDIRSADVSVTDGVATHRYEVRAGGSTAVEAAVAAIWQLGDGIIDVTVSES
jgi:GTP pyrophosphokinase